ncbi:hypothetical protein, partial [Burkholderia gladioli]|uniref:hypothetical protein n=1 Tax=Burkholderia gladioli TaxID=28095 RepID=UPI001ABB1F5A
HSIPTNELGIRTQLHSDDEPENGLPPSRVDALRPTRPDATQALTADRSVFIPAWHVDTGAR